MRPYVDDWNLSGRAESLKRDDVALTYTLEQIIQIEGWLKAYRIKVASSSTLHSKHSVMRSAASSRP